MSRGWGCTLVLEASSGRYMETSGSSFSMKESGFAVVAGAAVADDMLLCCAVLMRLGRGREARLGGGLLYGQKKSS